MPDSEQILLTGTKYRKQNSVSVEQIQEMVSKAGEGELIKRGKGKD